MGCGVSRRAIVLVRVEMVGGLASDEKTVSCSLTTRRFEDAGMRECTHVRANLNASHLVMSSGDTRRLDRSM